MTTLMRGIIVFALNLLCAMTWAACSRPIIVPAAPTGYSIRIVDNQVSGIYPELLRELGKKYGCQFVFPIVPRARAEAMVFNSGEGDLLLPVSRNSTRDQKGEFYYLTTIRPSLVFLKSKPIAATSLQAVQASVNLKGAFVRTYSYGDEYNHFLEVLKSQNRVTLVNDMDVVAKLINAQRADFTVVAATIFATELADNPDLATLRDQIEFVGLSDIATIQNGVYLGKSLNAPDHALLLTMLSEVHLQNLLRPLLEKYYSKELIQATFVRN
ncbi:transporter substrate-binding domain-containing protein [Chitinibacter sp. SCUT-21]|uniref:hypothetical protein n=1 Tax=Chitinibacter sp. SCUT-21 TaxID=2970891 RepID=UPI0035A6E3E0